MITRSTSDMAALIRFFEKAPYGVDEFRDAIYAAQQELENTSMMFTSQHDRVIESLQYILDTMREVGLYE